LVWFRCIAFLKLPEVLEHKKHPCALISLTEMIKIQNRQDKYKNEKYIIHANSNAWMTKISHQRYLLIMLCFKGIILFLGCRSLKVFFTNQSIALGWKWSTSS